VNRMKFTSEAGLHPEYQPARRPVRKSPNLSQPENRFSNSFPIEYLVNLYPYQ